MSVGDFSGDPNPPSDVFGNPITGWGYVYTYIGFGSPFNRCDASYTTNPHPLTSDPCDFNGTVLWYLDNSPNKPGDCNTSNCPSGTSNIDWMQYGPNVIGDHFLDIKKYKNMCEPDPGFCHDEVDLTDDLSPEYIDDENIGPAIYSRVKDNALKITFFKEVEVRYLEITGNDNRRLDHKLISWFDLPPSTTLKVGSYPVIYDNTSRYGYSIVELDRN